MYVVESIEAFDYHFKLKLIYLIKHKNKADAAVPEFIVQNGSNYTV